MAERGRASDEGRQAWSQTAVLTVRSPAYVGKVFIRDALHDNGPHEHLVEGKLFNRAQTLVSERVEDWSKRASATSPFLLAGLVVCA